MAKQIDEKKIVRSTWKRVIVTEVLPDVDQIKSGFQFYRCIYVNARDFIEGGVYDILIGGNMSSTPGIYEAKIADPIEGGKAEPSDL